MDVVRVAIVVGIFVSVSQGALTYIQPNMFNRSEVEFSPSAVGQQRYEVPYQCVFFVSAYFTQVRITNGDKVANIFFGITFKGAKSVWHGSSIGISYITPSGVQRTMYSLNITAAQSLPNQVPINFAPCSSPNTGSWILKWNFANNSIESEAEHSFSWIFTATEAIFRYSGASYIVPYTSNYLVFYISLRNLTNPVQLIVQSNTEKVHFHTMVSAGGLFKSCPFKPNPLNESAALGTFEVDDDMEYAGVGYIPPRSANSTLYFFELVTNDFQTDYDLTKTLNITYTEELPYPPYSTPSTSEYDWWGYLILIGVVFIVTYLLCGLRTCLIYLGTRKKPVKVAEV